MNPDKTDYPYTISAAPDYGLVNVTIPQGSSLRVEASAARVLVLCAQGRAAEARAVAERLLSQAPRSPLAPRLRASCALDEPAERDGFRDGSDRGAPPSE